MKLHILDRLGVLLDPRFWFRLHRIDHKWSDELEALLKTGEPARRKSAWRATLGGHSFWIENFAIAYGERIDDCHYLGKIPRRAVVLRLRRAVQEGFDEGYPLQLSLAVNKEGHNAPAAQLHARRRSQGIV